MRAAVGEPARCLGRCGDRFEGPSATSASRDDPALILATTTDRHSQLTCSMTDQARSGPAWPRTRRPR
jgi:hypothetical protein